MTVSELVNALCITYVATEYHLASASTAESRCSHPNNDERKSKQCSKSWWKTTFRANKLVAIVLVATVINILDRVSGAADLASDMFQGVLHAPKALLCATAYLVALFCDCRNVLPSLTLRTFGRHVRVAFCRVAPVYPILAVLISFVFMFVISLFEHLHLPLEWLNWPIYYGVLYGPFSVMYWMVKRRVVQDYYSLPTTMNPVWQQP